MVRQPVFVDDAGRATTPASGDGARLFRAPRPPLLLALLLAGLGACTGERAAPPAAEIANIPAFDGQAADTLIATQVAFGPRVPGLEGHARQLAWMEEYLRARADTLVVQSFTQRTTAGRTLELTNLIARFRPEAADRILYLTHWDTRPIADQDPDPALRDRPIAGANDGASGTAVLMQLADVLSRHSPPIGVDLLFVDGEDYGPTGADMYFGSTYFAANLPPGYRPLYGVLIDMVGDRDPVFPIEGYSQQYAPEVVQRVWRVAEELGYGRIFRRAPGLAIEDDHIPLNRAGIRTIDIIDFDYGPGNRYWHTHQDSLQNTGPQGLEAVGTVLTTLVYRGG
jgi:Zn-dependent M28 family amino/carboxypeptidase